MFKRELNKFKKDVEGTIDDFFGCSPDELKGAIKGMEDSYKNDISLDTCTYDTVPAEFRPGLAKYKTMKYFISVYDKLLELEEVLNGCC